MKAQECYTEAVRPAGGEKWPASTLDWLRRKLRKDEEVLDSGKNKMVELIKVAFYPEKLTVTQTHVNVTKILTDQSGPQEENENTTESPDLH